MAAPEEFNADTIDDDDIEAILNGIDNGEYDDEEEIADEIEDEIAGNTDEDEDPELGDESDINEDTDQDLDPGEADDTNDDDDGDDQDTSGEADDGAEEDTPVDDDIKDTKDVVADTTDPIDGEGSDTVQLDQVEYDKYKKFYEDVTQAEFTANGKKVKGFDTADKLISAQQMAYGYSDKMEGFKQYRPYMIPLKEKGYLDNPEKFNLALDLADGNVDALKKHVQSLGIDVMTWDLDEEKVDYTAKEHRASERSIAVNETIDRAKASGVNDRLQAVVGEQWDEASVEEFMKDAKVRNDLVDHMQNGVYDMVQDKIREVKATNYTFGDLKATDQYREALAILDAEYKEAQASVNAEAGKAAAKEAEKKRIADEQTKTEYAAQVQKKNDEADKARKKAANVSIRNKPVKTVKAKFDPMALDGDDLDAFVDSLIDG
jgi:hypothetical protein